MNEQLLNIRFVEEVEKHPCLYDYTLTEYSRRDVTEKAWGEVGKTVNLTGSQCKERWKNLRAVLVRHLKPTPGRSSTKKKKPYYLTETMKFAIPFIKVLDKGKPDDEEEFKQEDNVEVISNEHNLSATSPYNLTYSPISLTCPLSTPTLPHSILPCPPSTSPPPEYYNPKRARTEKKKNNKIDSRKMFLLSLLEDVHGMSDVQMRIFKRKVLGIIEEILEEPNRHTAQDLTIYSHPHEYILPKTEPTS